MTVKNDDPRVVYADIIDLPHHQAENRNHMSLYDRASQFAPFAALVGYDEMVKEEARLTEDEAPLSENEMDVLNQKLGLIADVIEDRHHPEISVVYFVPDALKSGGSYAEYTGKVKKIDAIEGEVIFQAENGRSNGQSIQISRIREIHGELVDYTDDAII